MRPARGLNRILRGKEEKYAWNRLDCASGFVLVGRPPEVEPQSFLGVSPKRRARFGSRRCGYSAAAWPDLIQQLPA